MLCAGSLGTNLGLTLRAACRVPRQSPSVRLSPGTDEGMASPSVGMIAHALPLITITPSERGCGTTTILPHTPPRWWMPHTENPRLKHRGGKQWYPSMYTPPGASCWQDIPYPAANEDAPSHSLRTNAQSMLGTSTPKALQTCRPHKQSTCLERHLEHKWSAWVRVGGFSKCVRT